MLDLFHRILSDRDNTAELQITMGWVSADYKQVSWEGKKQVETGKTRGAIQN